MSRVFSGLVAAVVVFFAGAATAATINFDSLPDEGALAQTYSENGITARSLGQSLAWYLEPGVAHLDDSGTGFATGLDLTTGGLFDAVNFRIWSLGYSFADAPPTDAPPSLFVSGFLGGSLVSSTSYVVNGIFGTAQSFDLGSAFAGIDTLRIQLFSPFGAAYCDAPCVHVDLDSVTLNAVMPAAVPLPASAALSLTALLALFGGVAWRRRKA